MEHIKHEFVAGDITISNDNNKYTLSICDNHHWKGAAIYNLSDYELGLIKRAIEDILEQK